MSAKSMLVAAACFAALVCWEARAANGAPLYRGESGWMIISTRNCEELVSRAFDVANKACVDISDVAPVFSYMGFHEPEKFYGIVLKIPDDITTYWGADVTVTMRYIRKGDTCRTESEEFIITSEKQKIFLHSFNIEGFVPIPTSAYRILQTGDGNPVIFVKFPLDNVPDKVVGFEVTNIRVKRR